MSVWSMYRERMRTAADAVRLVEDGDTIVVPIAAGEPPALLDALSEQRRDFHDVTVFQMLPLRQVGYLDPGTTEHVRHRSPFLGGANRPGVHDGWIDLVPAHFSEVPRLIRRGLVSSEVVFAHASPMDDDGMLSIGLSPDYTMAAIERARTVVLEVNPQVPFSHGHCQVHISQVTAVAENDQPLIETPPATIGEVERAIAGYVGELIPDGATLQIGIGAIPDAVVQQLAAKKDLGIHTEMLGDGLLSLLEAGVATNRGKNRHPGVTIATFALGSHRLYAYLDHNPAVELHPVDVTNDPFLAGRNDRLHSINGSLQVDLIGQCGSESLAHRPYSGTGGQVDFVRAANRSEDGRSFIVLPSTAKGGAISRISPTLAPGTHVTTGKNEVDHVVTEYGVAALRGRTARERAKALIAIAHPDYRAELAEAAEQLQLV